MLHLWLRSTAADTNILVYLEEVDAAGHAHFVTDGVMRASARALSRAEPFLPAGLPFHANLARTAQKLVAGRAARLDFALNPIAYLFHAGMRLRLTLTGAEADTYQLPAGTDPAAPPTDIILTGGACDSWLDLPELPPAAPRHTGA